MKALPLVAALFLATILWLGWGFWFVPLMFPEGGEDASAMSSRGQFGDLFGGVNALFTALAFAAVWWTGWMQQQELALQREELELQRGELSSTREVFRRQTFETTFFNQLELFRNVSESLNISGRDGVASKVYLARRIEEMFKGYMDGSTQAQFVDRCSKYFLNHVYRDHEDQLGPYFRILYHTFKMINAQDYMSEDERVEYANLARAQLGSDALIILAGDLMTPLAGEFIPLVRQYGILKHLPRKGAWYAMVETHLGASAFMSKDDRADLAAGRS